MPLHVRKSSLLFARLPVIAVLLLSVAGGCAQHRRFRAAELPVELLAPPVQNAQTLDLSRFAGPPVDHELIDRGDILQVSLAAGLHEDAVTEFRIRVGEDGTAVLPEIGRLQLAGLHLMDAEQKIAAACVHRGLYRQPHVTVTSQHRRENRITVVGAVEEPGAKSLPRPRSYLMAALVAAGGLSEDAGTHVEIQRWRTPTTMAMDGSAVSPTGVRLASGATPVPEMGIERVCLNLTEAVERGLGNEYLADGTVVTVQRMQPEPFQVVGLVNKPGRFDFPINHDVRVFGAIAEAGGLSSRFTDKVLVIRKGLNGEEATTIEVNLTRAKGDPQENLRLAPGDIVSVEPNMLTAAMDVLRVVRFGFGASVPLF